MDYEIFLKHYPEGVEEQQTYSRFFGDRDYDLLTKKKDDFLYNLLYKLSYATASKSYDECSHEVKHKLDLTAKKIIELSGDNDVHLSYTYLSILTIKNHIKGRVLLFRVLGGRYLKTTYFVEEEPDGRVYQGWEDYLKNCKLPYCIMLVPKNGFHHSIDGIAEVELIRSPSNTIAKCLNNIFDIASVASTGIAVASTFTPVIGAPFLIGSGIVFGINAIYNTLSTVSELADRKNHHQSISPSNKDAKLLYINNLCHLSGSISGASSLVSKLSSNVISARITAMLARSAKILTIISVSLQSYSIINTVAGLVIKFKNGSISQQDLNSLKHLCFLIANISLEPDMIRILLSFISDCPRMLLNVFNMTRNTCYSFTKCIRNSVVLGNDAVLDVLVGPKDNWLLKSHMPVTAEFISRCYHLTCDIRNGKVDCEYLFTFISKNYSFLYDVKYEMQKACIKLKKWCKMFWDKIKMYSTSNKDTLKVAAVEIVNNVNSLVGDLNIKDNEIEESCRRTILEVTAQISNKVCISNAAQLAQISTLVRNKIWSEYVEVMLLVKMKGYVETRNNLIGRIFHNCFSKEWIVDLYNNMTPDSIDNLPLLQEYGNNKIFMFSCAANYETFYDFFHCIACKLLNTDKFENIKSTRLNMDNLILIRNKNQTVIFWYNYDKLCACNVGIVMLLEDIVANNVVS